MRTSLLRLGAVALLAAGPVIGQQHASQLQQPQARKNLAPLTYTAPTDAPALLRKPDFSLKGSESTQAITWTNMWTTTFGPNWEVNSQRELISYDKGTNSVSLIQPDVEGTYPAWTGIVYVYNSVDNGQNWTRSEVFRRENELVLYPVLALANPGTTNAADLNWSVWGWAYKYDGSTYPRSGSTLIFRDETGVFDVPSSGPENNNPLDLEWYLGDFVGINGDAAGVYYLTIPFGQNQPWGAYGIWGWDFAAQDFATNTMPSQWSIDKFRPSGTLGSRTTSTPIIDADDEGRLYVVCNNEFADATGIRVPAVSISEDQGATWSDFARMPSSVLEAYRAQVGWNNISVYSPFTGDALVVTGIQQFSYFFRVQQQNDQQNTINIDIVEAKYNNGTWTLTRVAELNGFPLEFERATDPSNAISPDAWLPSIAAARNGHEVQVARAADGAGLVVKWIDEAPEQGAVKFGSTVTLYFESQTAGWQEFQYDSMYTTDVYFSYRTTSGSWMPKVNITNDLAYDHGTRMPRTVPSLESVPLIGLRPLPLDQYNQQYRYLPALRQLPALIYDNTIDDATVSIIQYGSFNAINPTSVNEEAETFNFRFNAVSPNPASNEAEVAFTTDAASKVMVEVFSTNGTRMATVLNTELGTGIHALTIDASNYASGTYYVALTVGGQRLTQPLVIVK